jgi:hypothetical protein
MKMPYGQSNLGCVKFSSIFLEPCGVSQVHEQLSSTDESHHKEDLLLSLENVVHSYQEGVISLH